MTAGGDPSRDERSRPARSEADGLGAFASESEPLRTQPLPSPGGAGRRLESSTLIAMAVVLAVLGYGGLVMFWGSRQATDLKSVFRSTPVQPYRPMPSVPATVEPPAIAPAAPSVPAASVAGKAVARPVAEPPSARVPRSQPLRTEASRPPTPGDVADARPRPEFSEDAPVPAPAPREAPDATAAAPALAGDATAAGGPSSRVAPPVDPLAADREAIGSLLRSYRTSYGALDATSVSTIWQGLDTRALQRAFATLSRQDVTFDRCDVTVRAEDRAAAVCRGVLTYVPKIGDGSPQQRRLAWTFEFQRPADRWLITAVSAR